MANLDKDIHPINQADISFWPTAIRYGVIGGVISMVYTLLGILTGFSDPSRGIAMIMIVFFIQIMIWAGVVVFAIRTHRDRELGGYITIGRAFILGLVASLIAMIINNIFTYVYIDFIDPSYVDRMLQGLEESFVGYDEVPEEVIAGMIEGSRDQFKLKTLFTSGLLSTAAIGAVVSIVCAAIMKKEV